MDKAVLYSAACIFPSKEIQWSYRSGMRGYITTKEAAKIGESQTEWSRTIALPSGLRELKNGKQNGLSLLMPKNRLTDDLGAVKDCENR